MAPWLPLDQVCLSVRSDPPSKWIDNRQALKVFSPFVRASDHTLLKDTATGIESSGDRYRFSIDIQIESSPNHVRSIQDFPHQFAVLRMPYQIAQWNRVGIEPVDPEQHVKLSILGGSALKIHTITLSTDKL